jgi:hypothetical protein
MLLNGVIRAAAVTGNADRIHTWFGGRQTGRWAEQTVAGALPMTSARRQRRLRTLGELQRRGDVTPDEARRLRARVSARA